jgi:catechol 2,3-dioxygenase-like lactoylglutathione lyase family enzyme
VSDFLKNLGAVTMFVEDVERSKVFYRDSIGLNAVYEDENSVVFDLGNTIINLLNVSEAPGLIAPAAVASRDAGSRFQLTIWVDDADAVGAELNRRGVVLLNGPMNRPWGMRTACFSDPDGHIWEIAQNLSKATGQ